MIAIDHYTKLNLKYNPFSYLNEEELMEVTEDRVNLESIAEKIRSSNSCFVEFCGKKGRGKSTHLQALYHRYFPDAVFHRLKKNQKTHVTTCEGILFIDSFQLLSLKNRVELLKNQRKLIIGAHTSHDFINFKQREFKKKVSFSNIDVDIEFITRMITQRMELARLNPKDPIPKLATSYIQELYKQYQDNLRGLQEALYDFFLNPKKGNYEL